MPERADQREVLIRYLFGVASVVEREVVEEECFAGSSGLDLLLGVEDELIDDYVRGALTTADRQLFEGNFLCTADRRQRLEFTQSLVEALAGSELGDLAAADHETLRPSTISAQLREGQTGTQIEPSQGQLALRDSSEVFARFLAWLDPVRETAAEKYETIRSRLIGMFASRGCFDAEALADQTIDRVFLRFTQLKQTYIGDPSRFLYAVARHVLQESLRAAPMEGAPSPTQHEVFLDYVQAGSGDEERAHSCLQKCLEQLSEENRELILQYYGSEKTGKTGNRKELAQNLGMSMSELRIRTQRIRTSLQKCVTSCLEEANDLP